MAAASEEQFLCDALVCHAAELHLLAHGVEATQRVLGDLRRRYAPKEAATGGSAETTLAPQVQAPRLAAAGPRTRWGDLLDDRD